MSSRRLVFLAISAIAATIVVMQVVGPGVDSLAEGFATESASEAGLFHRAYWNLIEMTNVIAGVAFLVIVSSGVPLAILALIANYSARAVRHVASSKATLRLFLTLQLMNFGLPVIATLLVASEGFDDTAAIVGLIALVYSVANFLAVRVWRDMLARISATGAILSI